MLIESEFMRTLNSLPLLFLLACAMCSATRIAIPPKSVEVLFMDAVQGEDNIVDIRLRYDVVGIFGPSTPKIECTLKSPRDRKVYYEFAAHGSVMHRARESGAYVIQFFNPTEHPVRVSYQYDALTFGGRRLIPGDAAADTSVFPPHAVLSEVFPAFSDPIQVFIAGLMQNMSAAQGVKNTTTAPATAAATTTDALQQIRAAASKAAATTTTTTSTASPTPSATPAPTQSTVFADEPIGFHSVLSTRGSLHISYVRFDLTAISDGYDQVDGGAGMRPIVDASLHMFVQSSDMLMPMRPGCRILHHFYDPVAQAHAPASEVAAGYARVERPDYRSWSWSDQDMTYRNRPKEPVAILDTECPVRQVLVVNVTDIVLSAMQAPRDQRQLTFEFRSMGDYWVNFTSKDAAPHMVRPHLSVAVQPSQAINTLLKLSDMVFEFAADQSYFRVRDREARDTNESTNGRVVWMSMLTWLAALTVALIQIVMIRRVVTEKTAPPKPDPYRRYK